MPHGKKSKSAFKNSHRNYAIFLFLIVEIAVGVIIWRKTQPVPAQGYLIKSGNSYIVLWKNNDQSMESARYKTLAAALEFAQNELALSIGPNPATQDLAQNVWVRDDMDKKQVFWQSENLNVAHRLTFQRPREAQVFEAAFKRGAYSTSPYGHSISLIPQTR